MQIYVYERTRLVVPNGIAIGEDNTKYLRKAIDFLHCLIQIGCNSGDYGDGDNDGNTNSIKLQHRVRKGSVTI